MTHQSAGCHHGQDSLFFHTTSTARVMPQKILFSGETPKSTKTLPTNSAEEPFLPGIPASLMLALFRQDVAQLGSRG